MRIFAAGALLLGHLLGHLLGQVMAGPVLADRTFEALPPRPPAWTWPLSGDDGGPPAVVRPFQPPVQRWAAGHRGLDLADPDSRDPAGGEVHAAGSGTVVFAGTLFGRGVVSIGHGALRTTYEPVTPLVRTGEQVVPGQPIGTLQPGHCAARPCLHWGLLTGRGRLIRYYDPSILLGPGRVRLEPVRSR
ncbi:MAG TPA: M23 family metallopeptidase [Actinocrinis sp.]|nr:M23 family metallopeptidase [Actinocrinis sp.]